ncbi:unnamed protein product, partial [Gongylonema pulchrum]
MLRWYSICRLACHITYQAETPIHAHCSQLNLSLIDSLPTLHVPPNIALSSCDLFNLTFSDIQDEELFEKSRGQVKC